MKVEMKFLVVLSALVIVFSSVLSASPVVFTGTGSGSTEEEAVESARGSLSEQIFSGVLTSTTTTAASDDTERASFSFSFSRNSTYVVGGNLPGLDYTVARSNDGGYSAVMTLSGDEATLDFYNARLSEMKRSAETFYLRYSSLSSSSSASEKRETVEKTIEYYSAYKMYSNVILRLGGDVSDDISIPVTIEVLLEDYQSLINEEDNYLVSADISETIRKQLDEKRKSQAEYNRIQEEARVQSELNRRLELENEIGKILEKGSSYSLLSPETAHGIEKLENNIKAIEETNGILKVVSDGYDELIESQSDEIEKSFQEESEAIWNRTYRVIDLDASQNPTSYAVSVREGEIEELRKRKDREKEEAISIINERLGEEIQSSYDQFVLAVKHLNEDDYLVSSADGDIWLEEVSAYDGSNCCWWITVGSRYCKVENIKIDIRSFTGLKIPSNKNELASFLNTNDGLEYSSAVSKYNALFKNEACAFAISFKAKFTPGDDALTVTLQSLDFEFADGKGTTVSLSDTGDMTATIELEESNYRSYSWLKKDYSIRDSVVEAARKHPIRDFWNGNTAWGFNFSFSYFYLDNMGLMSLGIEYRRYYSLFFISASCKYGFYGTTYDDSARNVETGKVNMYEIALGGGISNEWITLGCNMSMSFSDGLMLCPYIAFWPHGEKFNLTGSDAIACIEFKIGAVYNTKSNKVGFLVDIVFPEVKFYK